MVAETEQRWRERRSEAVVQATAVGRSLWLAVAAGLVRASSLLRSAVTAIHAALNGRRISRIAGRIFGAHLLALILMLGGIIYIMTHQVFLIEAKQESLKVQGQIIAEFIAASAVAIDTSIVVTDPDRLLDPDAGSSVAIRDQDLANLEFPIRAERVAFVLQNLVVTTGGLRARVYAPQGTLIFDSRGLTSPDPVETPKQAQDDSSLPRVSDLWTKFHAWRSRTDLPVYKEIGTANGKAYSEVSEALGGETKPLLLVNKRGQYIVSVAVPVIRGTRVLGALLLTTPTGDIDALMRIERQTITWFFGLALATALLSSILLARGISAPMRRLAASAIAVKNDIKCRTELPTFPDRKDEIGTLASAFREMTDALYRRVAQSEKFAADVSHELKNPITAVRSATESLLYAKTPEVRAELVECMQRDLKRLDKLITDISNFSRLDAELTLQEMEPVDLRKLSEGLASVFNDIHGHGRPARPVIVSAAPISARESYAVQGHEGRLSQVLSNLLANALSFSPPDASVTVKLQRVQGEIELVVEDEGPGIPADKLEAVFDRFYTDRPLTEAKSGKNTGLGLSISREILLAHGGRIWAENRADSEHPERRGARLMVRLPVRP